MSEKKILIINESNMSIASIGHGEYIFNKMIKDFEDDGKKISRYELRYNYKITHFTDGSEIILSPINDIAYLDQIEKFTHIYINKSIFKMTNGDKIFEKIIKQNNEFKNQELLLYEYNNGLKISQYKE